MEKSEYLQHWNYFCSLASKLEDTKNYVFHGVEENENGEMKLVHGFVYSDVFQQIIILAASEFEVMSKELCKVKGRNVDNIVDISIAVLTDFPKIIQTKLLTLFWESTPLEKWSVDPNDKGKKVKGLDWWDAYTALKHNETNSYKQATLENAISALSALYIINLYSMYIFGNTLSVAYEYPTVYFRSKYTANPMITGDGLLPDFGDKSPYERANELFPEMFRKPET